MATKKTAASSPGSGGDQTEVPTPLARQFVRYVAGFGVGVAAGLSVYLGKVRVPGFAPLLDLIPGSIQDTMIPLSSAVMGIVAVVIQWYGGDRLTTRWLRRAFGWTILFLAVMFVLLVVVHVFTVVTIPIRGGQESVSFQVGFAARPQRPPCEAGVSDAECIERLTFDSAKIASFWGDRQINLATLSMIGSYVGFTSSFGLLAGIALLRARLKEK